MKIFAEIVLYHDICQAAGSGEQHGQRYTVLHRALGDQDPGDVWCRGHWVGGGRVDHISTSVAWNMFILLAGDLNIGIIKFTTQP